KNDINPFPGDMYLTIRKGPKIKDENSRDSLLQNNIFRASGKSANLVSTGDDFSITLNGDQKKKAVESFHKSKVAEFMASGLNKDEAIKKANRIKTIPDKVYRQTMAETNGILMIYL